ncbi:MAG: diguanylate cyclase [Myxococcales bacterium]|nr:diguanylate cyclase [Myxococcales bacterium]
MTETIARAEAALSKAARDADLRSPMAATLCLASARLGGELAPERLVELWSQRSPGSPRGEARYRWELTHTRTEPQAYCPPRAAWTPWRPRDAALLARDADKLELRLTLPIAIADGLTVLARHEAGPLLREAEAVARADFASFIHASHAFSDCFALRALVERPVALERMRPFAIATAAAYTPGAEQEGCVLATRFPFHGRPLTSTTAMLAGALLELGQDITLAARLVRFVAESQRDGGAFGDDDEPSDVLTTFLAAELLGRLDPAFDCDAPARFFASAQRPDGFFRALGPETPWLTDAIARWLRGATQPFHARFRWPSIPDANRDRKTGLPPYAWFLDLTELFGALPGLASAPCTLAFLDLVGFRAFNNTHGQERGDAVLEELAAALMEVEGAAAVRDGGDELLLIGAPGADLGAAIDAFEAAWPARFAARFGTGAPVLPRILIGDVGRGDRLRHAREVLGRAVADLKNSGELRLRISL